jgi:DNA-binding MarR family transcriptional regulator
MELDETSTSPRTDFVVLLFRAADGLIAELRARLAEAGHGDIREAHGCVFGNIDPEGMRLTELAARAEMTKQAVGEAVSDLELLGYTERVADPADGRAKIIRLTERGHAAQRAGFEIIADIEGEWVERYGAERVEAMRSLLIELTGTRLGLAQAA